MLSQILRLEYIENRLLANKDYESVVLAYSFADYSFRSLTKQIGSDKVYIFEYSLRNKSVN
jgi:hypothetical protein